MLLILYDEFGLKCDRNDEIILLNLICESKNLAVKYDDLCQQVFDLDSQVRFAGVANMYILRISFRWPKG